VPSGSSCVRRTVGASDGGAFREVAEPERLVFTALGVDKDGKLLLKAHTTVTFTEDGGKTKLTLRARASARDSAGSR